MIMVMKKKTKKNKRFDGKICLLVFQKTNYTIYAIHQCRVLDWSPKCADNNNDDCVNDDIIYPHHCLIVMRISFGWSPVGYDARLFVSRSFASADLSR